MPRLAKSVTRRSGVVYVRGGKIRCSGAGTHVSGSPLGSTGAMRNVSWHFYVLSK